MNPASYTPLEPRITSELGIGRNVLSFNSGQPVSFYASTSFIYILFFVAIVAAAFYRYALAGVWRMQASQTSIGKSNEVFKTVTLGLLGVFSLFLILYTFNKDLLIGDVGLEALRARGLKSGTIPTSMANPSGEATQARTPPADEALARKMMSDAGININKDPCTNSQMNEPAPSCTNLGGLPTETLAMLVSLKKACACNITITGGTEPGHKSHGIGKRPVDLRIDSDTDPLFSFIKNKGTKFSQEKCYEKWGWDGFIFWDESPPSCGGGTRHFHAY